MFIATMEMCLTVLIAGNRCLDKGTLQDPKVDGITGWMEPKVTVDGLAKENWEIQTALIDMPAFQHSNLSLNFQKSSQLCVY